MERIVKGIFNGLIKPRRFFGRLTLQTGAQIIVFVDVLYHITVGSLSWSNTRVKVNGQDVFIIDGHPYWGYTIMTITAYRALMSILTMLLTIGDWQEESTLLCLYIKAKAYGVYCSLLGFVYIEITCLLHGQFQTAWTNYIISGIVNLLGIYGLKIVQRHRTVIVAVRDLRRVLNNTNTVFIFANSDHEIVRQISRRLTPVPRTRETPRSA